MMIQSVNNSQQATFGMALRKPNTPEATRAFAKYVDPNKFCVARGLKRFIKAQSANRFNIVHNAQNNSVDVLNQLGVVEKSFEIGKKAEGRVSTETPKKKQSTFVMLVKGIWLAITQPERWLPKELRQAGNYANKCERNLVAEEKALARAQKLEEKAIIKTERIFDSAN